MIHLTKVSSLTSRDAASYDLAQADAVTPVVRPQVAADNGTSPGAARLPRANACRRACSHHASQPSLRNPRQAQGNARRDLSSCVQSF